MAFKSLLLFCASILLTEVACQCIGREVVIGPCGAGYPYDGMPIFDGFAPYDGFGFGLGWPTVGYGAGISPFGPEITAGFGGGLVVHSASPITPTGLIVTSENAIEGVVSVAGQLPFLGAVVTDGAFATAGAGAVLYGCGDGAVGMVAEAPVAPIAPIVPAYGYGLGPDPFGYPGIGPYGEWGCGLFY